LSRQAQKIKYKPESLKKPEKPRDLEELEKSEDLTKKNAND